MNWNWSVLKLLYNWKLTSILISLELNNNLNIFSEVNITGRSGRGVLEVVKPVESRQRAGGSITEV